MSPLRGPDITLRKRGVDIFLCIPPERPPRGRGEVVMTRS